MAGVFSCIFELLANHPCTCFKQQGDIWEQKEEAISLLLRSVLSIDVLPESVSLRVSLHFCFMSKACSTSGLRAPPAAPVSPPVQLCPNGKSPCPGADAPRTVSFYQIQLLFDKTEIASLLPESWLVAWWCRASSGRHPQPREGLGSCYFIFSGTAMTSTPVFKM